MFGIVGLLPQQGNGQGNIPVSLGGRGRLSGACWLSNVQFQEIINGKHAFITSANLTGAGLGARHADKRNFEAGILTDEKKHIAPLMERADELFLGEYCGRCRLRSVCPDSLDGMFLGLCGNHVFFFVKHQT